MLIPVAKQLDAIRAADQLTPRKKVLILGAGMAGLAAALELSSLGHTVKVIEATNRVGGRVRTHRFDSGEYHELGAMRIPASHDYTRHYIALTKLDKRLRPFISAHKNINCFYHLRGVTCRIKDAAKHLFSHYHLSANERRVAMAAVAPAILGSHFHNTLNSLDDVDRASLFGEFQTDRVAALEQQTLGEYLEQRLESPDALELIGTTTGLEVWWHKAVSMFLRDEIVKTGEGLEEIEEGMDQLPTALSKMLPADTIQFQTEILSIELVENGVRLQTRATDPDPRKWDSPPLLDAPIEEIEADFVICTIPFGVLRSMSLSGLSAQKMSAIRGLNYASSTKVLLHCDKRFWEEGGEDTRIIGGASLSDDINRATYYPSDHASAQPVDFHRTVGVEGFSSVFTGFTKEKVPAKQVVSFASGPGVLVGSYNWGRDARRLGALSLNERTEAVIRAVAKFHPELPKHVNCSISMYWDDYRWSRGAFCFMLPGDLRRYYHAAIRPEGRLYFAGEHCSLDQGWMQGAIMSGLQAVKEVLSTPA